MKNFRDLNVWQIAHDVTLAIYQNTRTFPREETYGITSQLRRCSASVAANIAEGYGRSSNAEFGRFLAIAMGSASELEYFLLLARIWITCRQARMRISLRKLAKCDAC